MAAARRPPRVRDLSERQMECVLARNHVGRVAFRCDAQVELQPVHYVYMDGAIYGRTSVGTKYLAWLLESDVVFEVDESDSLFDWRSVIVRGRLSFVQPRGPRARGLTYWNAVGAIRTLVPLAFTDRDPVPHRATVFRIKPSIMTGRESTARDG